MISLKFIPLTFITSNDEIIRQIKNTVVFSHLFETYKETTLSNYIETTQYGFTASALESGSHKLLRITDIHHSKVNWESVPFCDCNEDEKYLLKENDILVARTGGTTGKSFFVENPPSNAIFASYLIRIRLKKDVNIEFINAFLNSYCFWSQIVEMKGGSAQPNVNAEKLKTLIIPDCDLETQAKAVRLITEENSSDSIRERINSVESLFWNNNQITTELSQQLELVRQLRQAFLREAMQGKLVPQDFRDEPAEILLEKIKAEKYNRLLACSGGEASDRRKRDRLTARRTKIKPVSEIKPEEIPFEIPNNWTWCRLSECSINRDGERIPISLPERERRKKIYDYYGASGVIDKIDNFTHDGRFLLIGEDGANLVARSTPIAFIAEGKFWVNNHAHVIETVDSITTDYLCNYLNGISLKPYITGGFQPKLSQGNLNLTVVPLPPLAEQKRIVEKLEKLMKYCDELEANIRESKERAESLLQVALKEALKS